MRLATLGLAIVAALAGRVPAARSQSLDTVAVRRWGEDLDFLAREMPAQHVNLFHAMHRDQFDSALQSIRTRLPSLTRHEVIVELEALAAMIGDGHSNVSPWRDTVIGFHTLPVALYRYADGYYIHAATRSNAALLGARVLRIGGIAVDSAERRVARLISRDNAMGIWTYAPMLLAMPEVLHATGLARDSLSAVLDIAVDGTPRTVTLTATERFPNYSGEIDKSWNVPPGWVELRHAAPAPLWLSRTTDSYWFAYVPSGRILYCQINEIYERGEPFEDFLGRALAAADSAGAERFVLDLRLNHGGNGFYNRAILRALVRSRFDARGRLFVITGRYTFSAAQMLISNLEDWSNPIFVGEPASSRSNVFGDSRRLIMPNSRVTMRVASLWWQDWDSREVRPWIPTTIAAPLTIAAYAAGRDPALEAIARWVPGLSLVERLKPSVAASDSIGAWGAITAFRADPVNAWQDPRDALAEVASILRGEGNTAAAALADRLRARLPVWTLPG